MTTTRSRLMAFLTVVAVLGVGVAIGVAVDRSLLRRQSDMSRERRGGEGGSPFGMMGESQDTAARNRMRGHIVKRLTDDLTLTPAQAQQVDAIFATRERQLDSLRARVGPRLDSLRDGMRLALDSVLSPSQRVKAAERRAKWQERRRRGGDREHHSRDER